MSVEHYFPVDTSKMISRELFLDEEMKDVEKREWNGKFKITTTEIYSWNGGVLPRRTPDSIFVDSTTLEHITTQEFRKYTAINDGVFQYKINGNRWYVYIEDNKVSHMIAKKRNKVLMTIDFSGLYKKENLTWPVIKEFDKNGICKRTTTILALKKGTIHIDWKTEDK